MDNRTYSKVEFLRASNLDEKLSQYLPEHTCQWVHDTLKTAPRPGKLPAWSDSPRCESVASSMDPHLKLIPPAEPGILVAIVLYIWHILSRLGTLIGMLWVHTPTMSEAPPEIENAALGVHTKKIVKQDLYDSQVCDQEGRLRYLWNTQRESASDEEHYTNCMGTGLINCEQYCW